MQSIHDARSEKYQVRRNTKVVPFSQIFLCNRISVGVYLIQMCSLYFNKIQLFLVSLKYTAVLKKYYSLCFYELYRNVLKTGTQTKCAQNWHTNKIMQTQLSKNLIWIAILQTFIAVSIHILDVWLVTSCSLVSRYQRLGETCCLNTRLVARDQSCCTHQAI